MTDTDQNTTRKVNPYWVVAAGTTIMLMLGVAYVWGVYVNPLMDEFGWSSTSASMPFSIFLLSYTAGMVIGGRLQDLYGPRLVCTLGALMFGTGYFLSGFSPNLIFLCLVYGVLGGLGTGFAYVTPVATMVKWFPEKKGLMSGIVIFGFGAGAFVFSPLVSKLIEIYSWQYAFFILGGLFFIVTTACAQFMVLPEESETAEAGEKESADSAMELSPLEMLKTPAFWLAWFAWFFALTVGLGTMGHIVKYATKTGIATLSAAFILSVVAVFNGLGRILMGAISDKLGQLLMFAFSCFAMAVVAVLFNLSAGMLWMFYLTGALFGLSFGALLILYPVITAELFGVEHLGANYGILFSSYGVGGFVGPLVFGQLYDATASYNLIFLYSALTCVIATTLVMLLRKRVGVEN
jgi:OFA family oxalate/formate antiporter-like MFS transporter